MMSFCKKSVHAFLGLASSMDSTTEKLPCKCQGVSALAGGLGLITAAGDIHRSNNVVESSTIKSTPPSSPPATISPKKDPRGICFIDDIGGGVDGLMSCTESLGFESSDERRVDDDDEIELCSRSRSTGRVKWRKVGERREIKKFPPPLSSFNHNGQPSFFLRPVRKDGRLELAEVRIDRPEILHAYRQDGRLRLRLIRNDCFDIINEAEEEQEQEQEESYEEEEQEQELEQGEEQESEEEKEEESVGEWRFPATGEGFRRCHELMSHHHDYHHHHSNHHHNLHVWRQHCVTSR